VGDLICNVEAFDFYAIPFVFFLHSFPVLLGFIQKCLPIPMYLSNSPIFMGLGGLQRVVTFDIKKHGTQKKIINLDFIKIKTFPHEETSLREQKDMLHDDRIYSQPKYLTKINIFNI
jgi:hypothetical protein